MKDVFIIRGKAYRRIERPKGNGCTDCAFRNKSCFSLKKVDCYHRESALLLFPHLLHFLPPYQM